MTGPNLLDDDGHASMATAFMMSHHAFRRDIARFAHALAEGDSARLPAVREEWGNFRGALHGHHIMEDTHVFPDVRGKHPELAGVIERLGADHRTMDHLLARGDRAFAELPNSDAPVVIRELAALLDTHLATEEASIVPHLRGVRAFPAPATEQETALYAQGFAWSSQGIAPDVLEHVFAMLSEGLRARIPAARDEFAARCERVWGRFTVGASRTSVPD